jgi:glycosyltransferase involved in cell wall biosynthesis
LIGAQKPKRPYRLGFLGTCVSESVCHRNPACSVAANNFQLNLLTHLLTDDTGTDTVEAISLNPVASFPRSQTVFSFGRKHRISPKIQVKCIPFLNVEPLKTFTAMIAFAVTILKWLLPQPERVRIILTYNLNLAFALPAVFLGRLFRVATVPIVADLPMPGSLSADTLLRRLEAWAQKALMRVTPGLIVLSRSVATDFAPGRQYLYMEGGVAEDLRALSISDFVHAAGSQPEKRVLFYSGGLGLNGGVSLLLDAFANLADFEGELWICGRGSLEKEIRSLAHNDPRICFWGFVGRQKYIDLLQRATVLINPRPSYPENRYSFPSKLLEYLASGRPVITTATPDVSEEYGDYVFLLREETPEALADLIEEVCALPPKDLDAFGAKARAYVLEHKTWDIQAKRVYDFLQQFVTS